MTSASRSCNRGTPSYNSTNTSWILNPAGYKALAGLLSNYDVYPTITDKTTNTMSWIGIFTYSYADRYILHRVISIKDGRYAVQGDGVYRGWEYPSREQILAKVSTILKNGDKAVDPYSPGMLRQVKAWRSLGGLRRYILFIDRHLRKYHED